MKQNGSKTDSQRVHAFHQLMNHELQQLDTSSYRNFMRIDAVTFEKLLCMVAPNYDMSLLVVFVKALIFQATI